MSKELTEAEKQALRKQRFSSTANMTTEEAKIAMEKEKEKMLERQKRFGLPNNEEEAQKRIERAKRFGLSVKEDEQSKMEARKQRFSTGESQDVLEKRKERFKQCGLVVCILCSFLKMVNCIELIIQ